MASIRNFYEKTSKAFELRLKFNGVAPNIEGHEVTLIFKKRKDDPDTEALLLKNASLERGEEGIALFNLTPEDTSLNPGPYFYEIRWTTVFGDVYILESSSVSILKRVFD